MKCQALFSIKNNRKNRKLSARILFDALRFNKSDQFSFFALQFRIVLNISCLKHARMIFFL